jgi:hypothetical protein
MGGVVYEGGTNEAADYYLVIQTNMMVILVVI